MAYGWVQRLHRIDRWPEISAVVTSVQQISEGGRGGAWRKIEFTYRVGSESYGGSFRVCSYSSLYELATGDDFDIQYDSRKPSRYFSEESRSLYSTVQRLMLLLVIVFVGAMIIINVFHL